MSSYINLFIYLWKKTLYLWSTLTFENHKASAGIDIQIMYMGCALMFTQTCNNFANEEENPRVSVMLGAWRLFDPPVPHRACSTRMEKQWLKIVKAFEVP